MGSFSSANYLHLVWTHQIHHLCHAFWRRQITARTPINHQDCAQGFHYIFVYHKERISSTTLSWGISFKKIILLTLMFTVVLLNIYYTKNIFNIHVKSTKLCMTLLCSPAPEVDVTTTAAAVQLRQSESLPHLSGSWAAWHCWWVFSLQAWVHQWIILAIWVKGSERAVSKLLCFYGS